MQIFYHDRNIKSSYLKDIVLGIGDTKARELLHNPYNNFTVRIGNRLYAHKARLDKWLNNQVVE